MSKDPDPDKPLAFRIIHPDDLAWILANGLHCANSGVHETFAYVVASVR